MKHLLPFYRLFYGAISALFGLTALSLIFFAIKEMIGAFTRELHPGRIIDALGLLAVALVALEISQTVAEEEVIRKAQVSAPTRVRRYLSRFLVVVVVALSIETLVGVMRFLHETPEHLPMAASIGFAAAAILAAWGVFIRLNRSAEDIEPDAMAEAKREDKKVE
jgi:hypothetical protein